MDLPPIHRSCAEITACKSVDGGATWFARSEGFPDSEILDLVVAPQEPHTIFAATRKRSVYQLTECSDP